MTSPSGPIREISAAERELELDAYAADQAVIAGVEQLRFFPLAITHGSGSTLTTASGRECIDLSASWTATGLGLGNPRITQAIQDAATAAPASSVLSAATARSTKLATLLTELTPVRGKKPKAYLGLAGTDANDVAIRAARHHTGRSRILTFDQSYHGGFGIAQLSSGIAIDADGNEVATVLPYPSTQEDLDGLRAQLDATLGAGDVAAVIVEALQCDGGVRTPPSGFLTLLREACDRANALLIVDEVKAGLARTGTLFAFQHEQITPDIVTLGKSLGGGLSVSAAVAGDGILDAPSASALLTTAGADIAAAAATAVLDEVTSAALRENVTQRAEQLDRALREYKADDRPGARLVHELRGRGLLRGIALSGSADASGSDANIGAKVAYRAWELGAVAYVVGDNVIELTPALTITEAELANGIDRLLAAIDDVAGGAVHDDDIAAYGGW